MDILLVILVVLVAASIAVQFYFRKGKTPENDFSKVENERLLSEKNALDIELKNVQSNLVELKEELASQKIIIKNIEEDKTELKNLAEVQKQRLEDEQLKNNQIQSDNAKLEAKLDSATRQYKALANDFDLLKAENKDLNKLLLETKEQATSFEEKNKNLLEKLESQKKELEEIGQKFTNEFKVLADKILDEKSQKFTEQNQTNIKNILEPLGKNLDEFKKRVEETYDKESKQRFSLEQKIKELAELNTKISEEAKNLTQALKGSAKKQGDWGEMILERILENSGLSKGREYHVQEFLRDDAGNTIKDGEGRKLQPDVIIHYPDERKIIIDSKVSLVAYERYSSAETKAEQDLHLAEHIKSLKSHIDNLSSKNYQNFTASLDFVMLFIPIEPAYLIAIQNDQSLWDYAYKKRILLISPTNLIAALKLLADLWQREYQNRNAIEIAERGGRLYDKFVSFVESLEDVGKNIDKSQRSYDSAMKQLKDGSGNLIGQVEKLKKLGVKAQKTLSSDLLEEGNKNQETQTLFD
jgi:DNA recombination protein RmuC